MNRSFYTSAIPTFLTTSDTEIIGQLVNNGEFNIDITQRDAWQTEIALMKQILPPYNGQILFEYSIPRLNRRIDIVLIINGIIFVLEFKAGNDTYTNAGLDQVWDYALDLKNFQKGSHDATILPILIATQAPDLGYFTFEKYQDKIANDGVYKPIECNSNNLGEVIRGAITAQLGTELFDSAEWGNSAYSPTPTIIEAASYMFQNQTVENITSTAASAKNIEDTCKSIFDIIEDAKANQKKAICFVTGVPGAGKTLVGLRVAVEQQDKDKSIPAVYLSGNGPLVAVLREALVRDSVNRSVDKGERLTKAKARLTVEEFIQNVHHFRDDCILKQGPPPEHIAIFDEAQRAWTKDYASSWMARKKNVSDFNYSESNFLISCLDRNSDWAVVICLVGGGQEINSGEAGISEWFNALNEEKLSNWDIYVSPNLHDSEYAADEALKAIVNPSRIHYNPALHLSVSMRSFRAEKLALFVKELLDLRRDIAASTYSELNKYPIVLTRYVEAGKAWIKKHARGNERYGVMVSSQAYRLRPFAITVQLQTDPVHWFLDDKDDIRSSYFMEDVATEFDVQGLELDWGCIVWDGDMRYTAHGWDHNDFKGSKWQHINKEERQLYQKNAYRVLLTRARQGMCIVVPEGNNEDATRKCEFYDTTYNYLKSIGIKEI
jgi:hypothetical protein